MPITRRTALLSAAAALPSFAITRARAADSIRIGVVTPLTGPGAQAGTIQLNSAKLSVEHVNAAGGVLGRPIELVIEDDATTNPGAVLAFSRLAADSTIAGFVGSTRSTQVNAMAPDVEKVGKPMMFGGTDPSLTHSGYKWLFRARPNDSYSGRAVAQFGNDALKKKDWAIVHSTDAFGTGGKNAVLEALAKLGVTPKLVQGYSNQQADFTPVVLAVKSSGADIFCGYFTFETDLAVFSRQQRQLRLTIPFIGSPAINSVVTMGLAKNTLWGTYGVADFLKDANDQSKAFTAAYRAKYNIDPDNGWPYDSVQILALAMNAAKSTDPAKVRDAIIAIKGYKGTEGVFNYDANGDGLHGYSIEENVKGVTTFVQYIGFPA